MAAQLAFWLTVVGTLCWPVCFWWMHRISSRQDRLLRTLQEQGKRIEQLSREEHALIQKVEPKVHGISDDVAEVKAVVRRDNGQ